MLMSQNWVQMYILMSKNIFFYKKKICDKLEIIQHCNAIIKQIKINKYKLKTFSTMKGIQNITLPIGWQFSNNAKQ